MTDILICALPSLFVDRLPGAPALLKGAVESVGFTATAVDFNLDFFAEQAQGNVDNFNKLCCAFRSNEIATPEALAARDAWLRSCLLKIKQVQPKILGLSIFSMHQHRAAYHLAQAVKQEFPNLPIVLGGLGQEVTCFTLGTEPSVKSSERIMSFHAFMTKKNLCDRCIHGTDLDPVIDMLEHYLGTAPNKISYSKENTVYEAPIPNYDDYRIREYVWDDGPTVPITGSQGCVRDCTFCDIPGQFGRFRYRTGEHIAQEIITISQKYGVTRFEFTDSLVNGSLKAFRQWVTKIAEYNQDRQAHEKITWFGQYICRAQKQTPKDLYPLMKQSGVVNLVMGIESGSNAILDSMRKKFTVQDVFDEFEQFYLNGIQVHVLMFGGFYNETQADYLDTLKFIVKCQEWVAKGVITKLSIGPPFFINEHTFIYNEVDRLGILLHPTDDSLWTTVSDPENNYVNRALKVLTIQLLVEKLGITASGLTHLSIHMIDQRLMLYEQSLLAQLNEFTTT